MFDTIATYLIVICAAGLVVWKLFLPLWARTIIGAVLLRKPARCAPDAETSGCAGCCPGCGLANSAGKVKAN